MAIRTQAKPLSEQLTDLADDLHAVANWIDAEVEMNSERKIKRMVGDGVMPRLRRRVGLIKWLLGIDNNRMKQIDMIS